MTSLAGCEAIDLCSARDDPAQVQLLDIAKSLRGWHFLHSDIFHQAHAPVCMHMHEIYASLLNANAR